MTTESTLYIPPSFLILETLEKLGSTEKNRDS